MAEFRGLLGALFLVSLGESVFRLVSAGRLNPANPRRVRMHALGTCILVCGMLLFVAVPRLNRAVLVAGYGLLASGVAVRVLSSRLR